MPTEGFPLPNPGVLTAQFCVGGTIFLSHKREFLGNLGVPEAPFSDQYTRACEVGALPVRRDAGLDALLVWLWPIL